LLKPLNAIVAIIIGAVVKNVCTRLSNDDRSLQIRSERLLVAKESRSLRHILTTVRCLQVQLDRSERRYDRWIGVVAVPSKDDVAILSNGMF
jgi:hypothetical protein